MFPIKYIDNNLVWNKDNEVFAYYELIPYVTDTHLHTRMPLQERDISSILINVTEIKEFFLLMYVAARYNQVLQDLPSHCGWLQNLNSDPYILKWFVIPQVHRLQDNYG